MLEEKNGLRVAISGYGLAGRFFHAPLLKATGFEIVAALTNSEVRRGELSQDFPEAYAVSTFSELIDCAPDLIVIASANIVHAEQAITALHAGIPVVVDKPMGLNVQETEQIIEASQKSKTPVTTYFNRRWDSDSLTIKRVLSEDLLGDVFRFDSRFERYRPNNNPNSWREKMSHEQGGGKLLDLQPHLISVALDCFGSAQLTHASVRSIRKMADDDSLLVLKHESGVDSYLSASEVMGATGPRIRLSGTQGSLVIRDLDAQEPLLRAGKYPHGGVWRENTRSTAHIHRGDEVFEIPSEPGNYSRFYAQVATALKNKSDFPVSTADALAVARIIDQAHQISIR